MTGQTHRYSNARKPRRVALAVFPRADAVDAIDICGEGADELRDRAGRNGGVWNSFGNWYRVTEGRISKASDAVCTFNALPLRRAGA